MPVLAVLRLGLQYSMCALKVTLPEWKDIKTIRVHSWSPTMGAVITTKYLPKTFKSTLPPDFFFFFFYNPTPANRHVSYTSLPSYLWPWEDDIWEQPDLFHSVFHLSYCEFVVSWINKNVPKSSFYTRPLPKQWALISASERFSQSSQLSFSKVHVTPGTAAPHE